MRITEVTLYRGVAVSRCDVQQTLLDIRSIGLSVGQGHWTLIAPDLRDVPDISRLISDPELSTKFTRAKSRETETFAATAHYDTALFYACKHNRTKEHTQGIIIEFTVLVRDIFVDGRDFLYTVFGLFDRHDDSDSHRLKVRGILGKLYGSHIYRYFDGASRTPRANYDRRLALVDLAINDERIILAHVKNRVWINGRYGTWLSNSFLVRGQIQSSKIVSAKHVNCPSIVYERSIPPFSPPKSYVSLDDCARIR